MRPNRVLETSLYVDNLDAAERFYREVIGLEFYAKMEGRHVFFRCGDSMFLLFNPDATQQTDIMATAHGARGAGHAAFEVGESEIADWRLHLTAHGVVIEAEVEWPAGGYSIYFRDPAGNSLEVATRKVWPILA